MSDEIKKAFEAVKNSISDDVLNTTKELIVNRLLVPEIPNVEHLTNPNFASEFHKRIAKLIQEFDANLDQEHEVGVKLVNFGQTIVFHLENMGFWNPSLISFKGFTDQGEPVELIQHVSQISILLTKVKCIDISQPKRQIGFASWENE